MRNAKEEGLGEWESGVGRAVVSLICVPGPCLPGGENPKQRHQDSPYLEEDYIKEGKYLYHECGKMPVREKGRWPEMGPEHIRIKGRTFPLCQRHLGSDALTDYANKAFRKSPCAAPASWSQL